MADRMPGWAIATFWPVAFLAICSAKPAPLPRLNIDPVGISVSGLSSGADFAVQFQVAFSGSVMGVGVFVGQAFHCAVTRFPGDPLRPKNAGTAEEVPVCEGCPPNATLIYDHCKKHPGLVDVKVLADAARRLSSAGKIDDVSNLQRAKVFTYCGTKDCTNATNLVTVTRDFFLELVPAANVFAEFSIPSGHCWPQASGGLGFRPCGKWSSWDALPLEDCGYDGPGVLLQHIYGPLQLPSNKTVHAHMRAFDQSPFDTPDSVGYNLWGAEGYIYVPQTCADGKQCKLHVMFHGCNDPPFLQSQLVHEISYNRWAETNDMVILYPYRKTECVLASTCHADGKRRKEDRQGCWDGYGQTGDDYDTREGLNMRAVRAMIETVAGIQMGPTMPADVIV